jgi:hypothetical protein
MIERSVLVWASILAALLAAAGCNLDPVRSCSKDSDCNGQGLYPPPVCDMSTHSCAVPQVDSGPPPDAGPTMFWGSWLAPSSNSVSAPLVIDVQVSEGSDSDVGFPSALLVQVTPDASGSQPTTVTVPLEYAVAGYAEYYGSVNLVSAGTFTLSGSFSDPDFELNIPSRQITIQASHP